MRSRLKREKKMDHNTAKFSFVNTEGNLVEVTSKKYSFNTEDVLINTFGQEAIDNYNKTGKLDSEFTLENVKEDFPQLLQMEEARIDWKEQDYDEMLRVYLFFLRYKKHALLRQYASDSETVLSLLEQMKSHLNSVRKNISESKKQETTKLP